MTYEQTEHFELHGRCMVCCKPPSPGTARCDVCWLLRPNPSCSLKMIPIPHYEWEENV